MRAEILPERLGLGPPLVVETRQVVIYGDQGTPIAIAIDNGEGDYEFAHARMPEFNAILKRCGVAGPVVHCEPFDSPRPRVEHRIIGTR